MSKTIVGVGIGGPAKFVATKVTYDSKFSGPYAGQTLVVLSTDSELDGVKYSVCKGNLSEADAARAANKYHPGLPMTYLHDGAKPLPAYDYD